MSRASGAVGASNESPTAPEAIRPGIFPRLLANWRRWTSAISEDHIFLLLAVVIGIFAGLAVVLFRIAIDWIQLLVLGPAVHVSPWRVLLAPTIAGFIVAALVIRVFPRVRGSGVNQTKAAVYIFDGYVPFSTVIGKFLTCAIAIGSGHSLGPEDPSLQIGAGIASKLGRSLKLSRDKIRLIAPVGAAAGLAAAFNAPISAVLFVIEEVIGNWSGGVLGAIVLAAVSSVVVMRQFLGTDALFRIPPFHLEHPSELLGYAVLGVIGGGASVLLLQAIAIVRPRLQRLPRWTEYFQPAIAGLLIGFIGLRVPQVMGAGYPIIDWALHDQFTWNMIAVVGRLQNCLHKPLLCQWHSGRHVRADALYRRDAWRGCWRRGAPFLSSNIRDRGRVCARRHGDTFCGISARADHFGFHGDRSFGKLRRNCAGDDFEHHRLSNFPSISKDIAFRSPRATRGHDFAVR